MSAKRVILTVIFLFLGLSLANAQEPRLKVVATYSILGDLVQNVGGNTIELHILVGPESDTHSYEPVPQDSVRLNEAQVLFENGLGFETWLDDLYSASGSAAERIVVSDGLALGTISVGDEAGEIDPHIWQNPYHFVHVAEIMRDTLARLDPANAVQYQLNANDYISQLLAADSYLLEQVQSLPLEQRKLVTDHDAFGYFASRYGFEIIGTALASVTTEGAEASAGEIAALIESIRATGTRTIFPENIENADLINQIAQEASISVGPPLCSDALSLPDGPCPSYLQMLRYNVDSIVGALNP